MWLADTSVLVYRFDGRFPEKQARASALLRAGIVDGTARIAHQAVLEFVAATTRVQRDGTTILAREDAMREAESLLDQFTVLYPTAALVRLALRGSVAYRMSWWDAHMWAYAEHHGIPTMYSEDLQHDGQYGTVRVLDPFV